MNTEYTLENYKIPGQEHLQIYVEHLTAVSEKHKLLFPQINKNGSSHFRQVIGLKCYEEDFQKYDLNNSSYYEQNVKEIKDCATREDFINLVFIREPAERLASSITHDAVVHVSNQLQNRDVSGRVKTNYNDPVWIMDVADMFLQEFSTFDLEEFCLQKQKPGSIIPGPKDCNYHCRIQFTKLVSELIQMPNTMVFHVDKDLSDNLLYFFEKHRPYIYDQIMDRTFQDWKDCNDAGAEVNMDEIYQIEKNKRHNNKIQNRMSYIYYTILPYLKDPRIQPNKIFSDYQKYYVRDIEMYRRMDPSRYFRRP